MSLSPSPLAKASACGNLEEVRSLVHNALNGEKHDALRIAVENNDLIIVDCLLANNIKPTAFDFAKAVEQCSYPILELLLSTGFDINTPIREDYPPPLAVAFFDLELVQWLISHGANPNARCKFDITPLSIAAKSASKDVIELLFRFGASTEYGQPLHFAVWGDRSDEIIILLLEKGASINAIMYEDHEFSYHHWKDFGLGTPLYQAARAGNGRLVQLLRNHGARSDIRNTLGQLPQIQNTQDSKMGTSSLPVAAL